MFESSEKEQLSLKKYYKKKPSNYSMEVSGYRVEPYIYQPTPLGAEIIAQYYRVKYNLKLNIFDTTNEDIEGALINKRFNLFASYIHQNLNNLIGSGESIGFLLMHAQHHVVPVIISLENDKPAIIIFDSNSGCRTRGYYNVAKLFPSYKVLLNSGTRQADMGSCVTDGLLILKDALQIENLSHSLFFEKKMEIVNTPSNSRLFSSYKEAPENFALFKMPETLLKTAQISQYVSDAQADLSKVISKKSNKTLGQHREEFKTTVQFNNEEPKEININRFLMVKSKKHAELIEQSTHLNLS